MPRTLRYNGGHWKKRGFTAKEVPSAKLPKHRIKHSTKLTFEEIYG